MHKNFTPDQANKSLVLVRPILEDIRDALHDLRVINCTDPTNDEAITAIHMRLRHYLGELIQIGCIPEDLEKGAVVFPCIHMGQELLLNWKLGEEKVSLRQ